MYRLIFMLIAAAVASSGAYGQSLDGSAMLRVCGAAVKQAGGGDLTDEESIHALYCVGYVSGFLDALSVTANTPGARQNVCLPQSGITNDEVIQLFVKFLRENPQTLRESGRMSLNIALSRVFPCK